MGGTAGVAFIVLYSADLLWKNDDNNENCYIVQQFSFH